MVLIAVIMVEFRGSYLNFSRSESEISFREVNAEGNTLRPILSNESFKKRKMCGNF